MKFRLLIFCAALWLPAVALAGIRFDKTVDTPQGQYAQRRLSEVAARITAPVELAIDARLGSEAFVIEGSKQRLMITGGDARGLIYGALDARERLLDGAPAQSLRARSRTPRLAFRGIKLNTPWDSYRASSALAQHAATMHDRAFWEAYLDMMVENRFNSFTLWTLHPFT